MSLNWPLGVCLFPEATTWLAPPINVVSGRRELSTTLQVRPCRTLGELTKLPDIAASVEPMSSSIVLGVGIGHASGHVAACYKRDGRSPAPVKIHLVGSETVPFFSIDDLQPFIAAHQPASEAASRHGIWGPTRAALGEDTWRCFRSQRFGIVGAGRTGSGIAESLHRNGANIVVFDEDSLEPSNLGETWLAHGDDVYLPKVQVIVDRLKESSPNNPGRVAGVAHSILSLASLAKLKDSTVLISAVDNPRARLMAAFLSVIYMIPLLDVGTGIFHRESENSAHREMGADIRLCLPGRCLLCSGGIHNVGEAIDELKASFNGKPVRLAKAWFEQRSGSLRSLNSCAMSFGLRLIEDWLAHRLPPDQNAWLHLEFSADGTPVLQSERFPHDLNVNCPLCPLTGFGDFGLRQLSKLLTELSDRR